MVNASSLAKLFESKGILKEEAQMLAAKVLQECPWFESDDELSEEIGVDLLTDALDSSVLAVVGSHELIKWHNFVIAGRTGAVTSIGERDAYAELCSLIGKFGVEDPFGDGDYWVVADSFASANISVVKFADAGVAPDLQSALQTWLTATPGVSSVSVITEDGDVLFEAKK